MEKQEVITALTEALGDRVKVLDDPHDDAVIRIERTELLPAVRFLRESPWSFKMLLDMTCVDFLKEADYFEMVYHLFSLSGNLRLRIKIRVPEKDPVIDSLTEIWRNANWLERELFDMFGIRFTGHPDLRRLFMYDGFEGYPLRKDYPLRRQQPLIPLRETDAD
jgi:NADH-quinone oxidoreductase subunit C